MGSKIYKGKTNKFVRKVNTMKKIVTRVAVLCLTLAILLCGSLSVSASSYVSNVVCEDFSSADSCNFLAPGDMNADGLVNAVDAAELRKLLLKGFNDSSYTAVFAALGSDAKYSDVNGDAEINIVDLVRQKKHMAESFSFVKDGVMQLNGKSAYAGEFTSIMGTGASYVIKYSYKSDASIKVIISGLGDDIVYENAAVAEMTAVEYTIKTPLSLAAADGIELQIIGVGVVDSFSVNRINMDNEFVEIW